MTDYYVSTAGSDSTGTGGLTLPWLTIQKAINTATNGDRVLIRAGTYQPTTVNAGVTIASKTGAGWLIIQPYANETVIVDGTNIGTGDHDGIFYINGSARIRISGLYLQNSRYAGIMINNQNSSDITIDNNHITNSSSRAIATWASGYSMTNLTIDRNIIDKSNTGWSGYGGTNGEAVSLSNVNGFTISNNIITRCGTECVDAKVGCRNGSIHHNSIDVSTWVGDPDYRGGHLGIYIDPGNTTQDAIFIFNNYIFGDHGQGVYICPEGTGTAKNIQIYNNLINLSFSSGYGICCLNYTTFISHFENINIHSNTVYTNTQPVHFTGAATIYTTNAVQLSNNIFMCTGTTVALYMQSLNYADGKIALTNNLFYSSFGTVTNSWNGSATTFGANAYTTNPLFATAGSNFHLQAASAAINHGATVTITADYEGTTRPVGATYDIGAYEFVPAAAFPGYYVSKYGNNSWNGKAPSYMSGTIGPFLTINKAITSAIAGDTVYILPGIYEEKVTMTNKQGSSSAWITITSYNGEVCIDGTTATGSSEGGIIQLLNGTQYIRISEINLRKAGYAGIYINGNTADVTDIKIDHCDISSCCGSGIYAYSQGYSSGIYARRVEFAYNTVHDVHLTFLAQEAISFSGVQGFEIHHNTLYHYGKEGIDCKSGSSTGSVHHNNITTTWIDGTGGGTVHSGIYIDGFTRINHDIDIYCNSITGYGSPGINLNAEHPESGGAIENINVYNNVINTYSYSTYPASRCLDSLNNARWTNVHIYNNTFNNGTSANHVIRIFPPGTSISGLVIANNIFYGHAYSSLYFSAMTTAQASTALTLENNLYYRVGATTRVTYIGNDYLYGSPAWGSNALNASPSFTNTLIGDLLITAASPCINTGTTDYYPATDFRDYNRSGIPDIGAFEYGATSSAEMSFGNTTYDGTVTAISGRVKALFAAPLYDGDLNSISVCIYDANPAGATMKAALYQYVDWGTSYAGQLIGETEEVTLPLYPADSTEWVPMYFTTPIPITAGTNYYLAVAAEGTTHAVDMRCLATGGQSIYTIKADAPDMPNPFLYEQTSVYKYAIVGNYTPYDSGTTVRLQKFLVGYGTWDAAQIDWIANTFDMVDMSKQNAIDHATAIKAVNPNIKIIGYIYPQMTPDYFPDEWNRVIGKGPQYFCFDHTGTAMANRIYSIKDDGNAYYMNLASTWPGDCYKRFYTSYTGEYARTHTNIDGFFYDTAVKWLDRESSDMPTGYSSAHGALAWSDWNQTTLDNWAADSLSFSQSMQSYLTTACPGRDIIVPNAWKWTDDFCAQVHHWHFWEHFIYVMNGPKETDGGRSLIDIDYMIEKMSTQSALGNNIICGGGGYDNSDPTWVKKTFNMCFAGALMATQNMAKTYFAFNFYPSTGSPGRINYYPEMDWNFGNPLGNYSTTFSGEVYTRTFEHYYVAVNFGNTDRTVILNGTGYSVTSRNAVFIERAGGSSYYSRSLTQINTLADTLTTNYVSGTTIEPMVSGHYFDLIPVSNASRTGLDSTEVQAYQAIDDTPTSTHDANSTFTYSQSTLGAEGTFFTDSDQVPEEDFDVYKVVIVGAYANNALGGQSTVYALLKEHGVITTSSAILPPTSQPTYTYVYTTYSARPSDGLPWTKADVSPLEFGHRLTWDSTKIYGPARCTQQFARIYFGPPGTIWNEGMPSTVLPPIASSKCLARSPDGRIHAVYKGPTYTQHIISSTNGYTWGTPYNLASGGMDPTCTPDSSGNIHILWDDSFLKYNKYNITTNAFDGVIQLSNGTCRYPDICVDSADNLHIVHVDQNANPACVYYDKRVAGAWSTYSAGEVAITTVAGTTIYSTLILSDSNNNLHTMYYSTDGAVRWQRGTGVPSTIWSATTNIADGTWPGEIPSALSDSAGNIHVVWKSKNPSPAIMNIRYRKWNVSNNTWNAIETITADNTYCQETPTIAVDKASRLYVIWAGKCATSPTIQQLRYVTKASGATTWSAVTELTSQTSDQWRPMALRQGYYPLCPTECFGTPRPHESYQGASFIYRDHLSTFSGNNDALIYGWTDNIKYSYPNIAYINTTQISDNATYIGANSKFTFDMTTGRMYAAYLATVNGQPNVFASESYTDGADWFTTRVSSEAADPQSTPSLSVGTWGTKHIVWCSNNTMIYWSKKQGSIGVWAQPTTIAAGKNPVLAVGANNVVNFMWLTNTGINNIRFKRFTTTWEAEEDFYANEVGDSMSTWSATYVDLAINPTNNQPYALVVFTNQAGTRQKLSIVQRDTSSWSPEYQVYPGLATYPAYTIQQPSLVMGNNGQFRCSYVFTSYGATCVQHQLTSDVTTWTPGNITTMALYQQGVVHYTPDTACDSTSNATIVWTEYSSASGMWSLKYKQRGAGWPTSTVTAMCQAYPIKNISVATDLTRPNVGFAAVYTDMSPPASVNLYITTYAAFAYSAAILNESPMLTDAIKYKISNKRQYEYTTMQDTLFVDAVTTADASVGFFQAPIEWLSSNTGDYNLQMGTEMAQTFTIGRSGANKIFIPKQVDLRAYRTNTTPGDLCLWVSFWTVNASGAPAGTPLAVSFLPASWLSATASHLVSLPCSDNTYRCQPNTTYALVSSITGGDAGNYVYYKGHSASPYQGGGRWLRTGGAWTSTAGNTMFTVRGTVPSVQQQAATQGPFFTTLTALTDYVAQTFIPTTPFSFCKVGFSVKTYDRGLTTLSAWLTTCDSTGAPGTATLWGTTNNGQFFSTISASWFMFETSESAEYRLQPGQLYAVCLKKVGAGGPILYVRNSATATSTGNLYISTNSGTSWSSWTADCLHEIWSRDNCALITQSIPLTASANQPLTSNSVRNEGTTLTDTLILSTTKKSKLLYETMVETGGVITPEQPLAIRKVGNMILVEI